MRIIAMHSDLCRIKVCERLDFLAQVIQSSSALRRNVSYREDRDKKKTRRIEYAARASVNNLNHSIDLDQSSSPTLVTRKVRSVPSCSFSETYSPGTNLCVSKRKPASSCAASPWMS